MKVTRVADAPVHPNPHGVDARKLYDSEHAQAVAITLQPGEQLKKHITPVDAIFFVTHSDDNGRGMVPVVPQ